MFYASTIADTARYLRPMRVLAEDEVGAHVGHVAEQGFTVIEDAIDSNLIDELAGTLDRLEQELGITPADNAFEGRNTARIYNLLVHGDVFTRVPVHANVLPVVEGVLDPQYDSARRVGQKPAASGCLLSSLSSIAIAGGETAQPIHADDQLIPLPKPHPPVICNTMWALTDFTEANGATRLVSGSHLQDSPDFGRNYDSVPAVMGKGSVLVWHGSLWHGGGANTTDERRVGIACNYCAGYIRQQENQQLGIPRAVAVGFDDRLARLCGYGIYSGLIGHIDKRDPIELLRGSAAEGMVWDQL